MVLAVTGAEALYADMGHFGRAPISRVWLLIVFPACMLSYMGQGALVLGDPRLAVSSNPFFLLPPHWGPPADGVSRRCGHGDRVSGRDHRSVLADPASQPARIPAPAAHRAHLREDDRADLRSVDQLGCYSSPVLTLVFAFKSSAALAYAYGMAVTGTITITTLLYFYHSATSSGGKPLWLIIPGAAALLTVDLLFFAANLTKFVHGAWLPLLIGIVAFTVFTTWQRGRSGHSATPARRRTACVRSSTALPTVQPPLQRVPGTAVFLNRGKDTTPLAMRANVEHNHVLHKYVIVLSIETLPVPHVTDRATAEHRPAWVHR